MFMAAMKKLWIGEIGNYFGGLHILCLGVVP